MPGCVSTVCILPSYLLANATWSPHGAVPPRLPRARKGGCKPKFDIDYPPGSWVHFVRGMLLKLPLFARDACKESCGQLYRRLFSCSF